MKALVFVLITVSFTSVCLAQTCGIHEWEADLEFSNTWEYLVHDMLEDKTNPDHWKDKEADYYINAGLGPSGGAAAINAAAASWNASNWKGANNFTFRGRGSTTRFANKKDGQNVIAFQPLYMPTSNVLGRTYYMDYEWWPIINRDRLKEVNTIINTDYYWATGPSIPSNHNDVQSVMAHEFGHWLVLEHLYPWPIGCDEYNAAVMSASIGAGVIKRTLHWIDDWGKWYIYSSGKVPMAPPIEKIPPPLQSAVDVMYTRLLHNYPDPFNPETWMPYELADDAEVDITIYDSSGRPVRYINVGMQPKGRYIDKAKAVHWDGKDNNGAVVASGVYFYTLTANDFSQTKRLVILK